MPHTFARPQVVHDNDLARIDLKKMNHEETKSTKRRSEEFIVFSFLLRVGLRGEIA